MFRFLPIWVVLCVVLTAPVRADFRTQGQIQQEISKELKAGRLHPDLKEELRIDESKAGEEFQTKMSELFHQLYPNHDLAKEPVRFLLLQDKNPNAMYFSGTDAPPIFAFSSGLLEKVKNRSQMLGVLAHEFNHYRLFKKLGTGGNSKGEETWSDIASLRDVIEAGGDPTQVLELHREVFGAERFRDPLERWSAILDIHPSGPNRVRAIELALTQLHRELGPLRRQDQPLDPAFERIGKAAIHRSYIDDYLEKAGFKGARRKRKFEILTEAVRTMPYWNEARKEDLARAITGFLNKDEREKLTHGENPWSNKPSDWEALNTLADALLEIPAKGGPTEWGRREANGIRETLYTALVGKSDFSPLYRPSSDGDSKPGRGGQPVLGRLRAMREAWEKLMHATSAAEAAPLVATLHAQLEFFRDSGQGHFLGTVDWPQFTMPDPKTITSSAQLPWNPLVELTLADKTGKMQDVLFAFGIHDDRLFEGRPMETIQTLAQGFRRIAIYPAYWTAEQYHSSENIRRVTAKGEGALFRPVPNRWAPPEWYNPYEHAIHDGFARLANAASEGDAASLALLDKMSHDLESLAGKEIPKSSSFIATKLFETDPEMFLRLNAPLAEDRTRDSLAGMLADCKDHAFLRKFFLKGNGSMKNWEPGMGRSNTEWIGSPIHQLFFQDPWKLFTDDERRQYLLKGISSYSIHEYVLGANGAPEELWNDSRTSMNAWGGKASVALVDETRRLLGYERPKDWEALYAFLERFRSSKEPFIRALMIAETNSLLRTTLAKDIDLHRLVPLLDADDIKTYGEHFAATLGVLLEKQPALLQGKPAEAIRTWSLLNKLHALPKYEKTRSEHVRSLLTAAEALPPAESHRLIGELLLGGKIEDPALRARAVASWAKKAQAHFGKDDGSATYADKVRPLIAEITDRAQPGHRYELLRNLADAIESQEALSEDMRKSVSDVTRRDLMRTTTPALIGEFVLGELGKNPKLVRATTRFLTEPSTAQSQQAFFEAVQDTSAYRFYMAASDQRLTPDDFKRQFDLFHREYWSQPLLQRAVLADFILLPPEERSYDEKAKNPEKLFEERFDFVLKEILPHDPKYGEHTSVLLKAYLSVLEPYQRGPYLAAVMAAVRRAKPGDPQPTAGEFLAIVLEQMGPAERKAVQAIHSYPGTPEDLREGIGHSKTLSDPLARWDMWTLVKKLPQAVRNQIERINGLEGAASFWQVMHATLKAGSDLAKANGGVLESALGLLRPNAAEITHDGFDRARRFSAALPHGPIRSALSPILEEAEQLAGTELNPKVTEQQFELAGKRYRGTVVEIDGERFEFDAIRLIGDAHGEGFRLMTLAKGTHFNALPEDSPEARASKRKWALAHTFLELSFLLSGVESDEDPHGGNSRVGENKMIRMDPGGFALHPPNEKELRVLGEVFYQALAAAKGDPEQTRIQLLVKLTEAQLSHPKEKPFLVRTQKTLLALQDNFRHFEPGDLVSIFQSLHKENLIHADVVKGLTGGSTLSALKRLPTLKTLAPTDGKCKVTFRLVK